MAVDRVRRSPADAKPGAFRNVCGNHLLDGVAVEILLEACGVEPQALRIADQIGALHVLLPREQQVAADRADLLVDHALVDGVAGPTFLGLMRQADREQ